MKYKILQNIVLAGIIWTGVKQTPAELAAILKPNEYKPIPEYVYGEPKIYFVGFSPQWYEYNLYWRYYYHVDQRRIDSYQATFRGFTPQVQDRRSIRQYQSWNSNYRKRIK